MDDIVKAALKKWPDVPHCYGWLALDARGDWYLRDEAAQRAGAFPNVKGSRVDHDKLKAFIERNYLADDRGQWFFQNGPQRVYLQLEATPWVWRVHWRDDHASVTSHTGLGAQPRSSWLDEQGRLYLDTDIGFGIVHSADMGDAARAVELGLWQPEPVRSDEAPKSFGFIRAPQPAQSEPS